MKKRRLPPLNPIKSFEAAGRHSSFSKAAEELNVSPVAISKQIKVLEDYYDVKLFRRESQFVILTEAGRNFLPALTKALDTIDAAASNLRTSDQVHSLSIYTYSSFAINWLIPRLNHFQIAHPEIAINLGTAVKPEEFDFAHNDLSILFNSEVKKGIDTESILPDIMVPICSPHLLNTPKPPTTFANLSHHIFLHNHYRRLDWNDWLNSNEVDSIIPAKELTFRGSRLVYQAAVEGLGIAIAQLLLVQEDIKNGRLVIPLNVAVQRSISYCLAYKHESLKDPSVRAFHDWIITEAQEALKTLDIPICRHVPTNFDIKRKYQISYASS